MVVRAIRKSAAKIINWMETFTFSSDYRAELAIIESVYRQYAEKIESGEPSKYLWRAICQYRCQCTARKKSARFAANVAAFACLPLIPLFIREQNARIRRRVDT